LIPQIYFIIFNNGLRVLKTIAGFIKTAYTFITGYNSFYQKAYNKDDIISFEL